MTAGVREQAFAALFAIGEGLTWLDPVSGQSTGFQFTSRRVKSFGDLPAMPAICQAEGDEDIRQKTGLPYNQTVSAHWVIYHNAGADPSATPASTNNAIVDAAVAALSPPPGMTTQTLGGLANHVWINGKVFKDPGDLDTQGLIILPISILLPL